MKMIAFNGSPRKEGNTHLLIQRVLGELHKEGVGTESVHFDLSPISHENDPPLAP